MTVGDDDDDDDDLDVRCHEQVPYSDISDLFA